MESRKAKKLSSKAPDLHRPDPGQAPKTEQKADACLQAEALGIEPLITHGRHGLFQKLPSTGLLPPGLLASKPDDRMEMEEIIIVWN